MIEEKCEICDGDGVIPKDEWDTSSHSYISTGEQPCECQK